MDQLLQTIRSFDGLLEFAPTEGDEFPPTAWGDHFFYYAPDGQVPKRQQPYATIVTKNYPDDSLSDLDKPGRWRLNIHVGTTTARELTDKTAVPTDDQWDFAAPDVVFPHPLYRHQGWVSIVNPGARTSMLLSASFVRRTRPHVTASSIDVPGNGSNASPERAHPMTPQCTAHRRR